MIGQIRLPVDPHRQVHHDAEAEGEADRGQDDGDRLARQRFDVWSSAKISDESTATTHALYPRCRSTVTATATRQALFRDADEEPGGWTWRGSRRRTTRSSPMPMACSRIVATMSAGRDPHPPTAAGGLGLANSGFGSQPREPRTRPGGSSRRSREPRRRGRHSARRRRDHGVTRSPEHSLERSRLVPSRRAWRWCHSWGLSPLIRRPCRCAAEYRPRA